MKVDMFKDILPAINRGDKNFYNELPPEMKKSSHVNFWMIHRWATCTQKNKEHYLMFILKKQLEDVNKLFAEVWNFCKVFV